MVSKRAFLSGDLATVSCTAERCIMLASAVPCVATPVAVSASVQRRASESFILPKGCSELAHSTRRAIVRNLRTCVGRLDTVGRLLRRVVGGGIYLRFFAG